MSRTKKKRDKQSASKSFPIISPNVLKNKLLKRIKEHKQQETQHLGKNNKIIPKVVIENPSKNDEILNYSDEFNDSLNYLQTLSKQKHYNDEKTNNQLLKQKQKEELERRTIKNYHSLDETSVQHPIINIDLPDELLQSTIQNPLITDPYKINSPYKGDGVPYGILKGGSKPSYREWSKTQRNNIVTIPNSSLIIDGVQLSTEKTTRENRLDLLKEKIKQREQLHKPDPLLNEILIKRASTRELFTPTTTTTQPVSLSQPILEQSQNNQTLDEDIVAIKYITKKTIKRKYTLGKSETKRRVCVLIKDRRTQKKILNAQKDLKRKNINEVKEYLRHHNLIKIGSNAPNDVLRSLYEASMLSGEITNRNSNILLYNFSKESTSL